MKTLRYLFAALALTVISATYVKAAPTPTDKVLTCYLGIKNALANDDSKTANDRAKEFAVAIKDVSTNELDAKQKETWLKYYEKLRYDSEHISESTAIDHQREHFASLSKNLYEVIKTTKTNSTTLYMQYCPMKKESWLSEMATIKNPYYGKNMIDCGKTTETLKGTSK